MSFQKGTVDSNRSEAKNNKKGVLGWVSIYNSKAGVWLQVSCKILTVQSGADMPSKGRELARHFESQGTPVMIGRWGDGGEEVGQFVVVR